MTTFPPIASRLPTMAVAAIEAALEDSRQLFGYIVKAVPRNRRGART
jgi:hypothetical protein